MLSKDNCTRVAHVAKTHGVSGEVAVQPIDGFDIDVLDTNYVFIDIDGGLVPFEVESFRTKGVGQCLLKLSFTDNLQQAEQLCGLPLYVDNAVITPTDDNDEVPIGALIGYEVIDTLYGHVGAIVDLENANDNNPLFVVAGGEREFLIPIADELIVELDAENKKIIFDLPEGLIDLE